MCNDSADGRAVGTHPESFSGRAYPRWSTRPQSQFQPVVCLKRCCGYSTQARNGTCYRKAIRTIRLWIGVFRLGAAMRCFASSSDRYCQRASRQRRAGRERVFHRCDLCYGQGWWSRNRRNQTRKRHENHGNCGSPWITTVGQHACGQPSRGPFGAAVLRLLHGRSQAGEFDRRSRL